MGWESNDYDFMGDTDWGNTSTNLDPTGMDSWNTGSSFANNPNAGGTAYDLGYDNSWSLPTDYTMGPQTNMSNLYGGGQSWQPPTNQPMIPAGPGAGYNLSMPPPPPADMSGTEQFLNKLFSDPRLLSQGLGSLMAGVEEKKSNKGRTADLKTVMASPQMDPFGSQRPQYQQLMSQTYTDPMSNPLIKNQMDQNVARMERVAAARGVRFNPEAYREQLSKQNTTDALAVMKDLQGPAGAGIAPNSSVLGTLGAQAAQYNNTGNAPIYSAIANTLGPQAPNSNAQVQTLLAQALQQNPQLIQQLLAPRA